ncbi:H-NS histone family protein [Bradyrhizobium sp. NFR13]|jgi:DNA-binding protein H-NS|uniref:H-NS histone family protein n=1 Tax=Bradyrhizobium sp. NFR13 TaxID=1566285 RepID=UPI0008E80933|nr:H-NS histone family protein [Bradyrhizobium sp. NFR13]SFL57469.1 H-NS histone family protein [Bradyrhizobium sp. NFR13]
MPTPDIKSLSVPELLALRQDIDKQLQAHRAELQAQLAQIRSVDSRTSHIKGIKVPPKYRHPKTGETWTGRGGVAGWLAKEIAAGRKREDFLIDKLARNGRAKTK